MRALALAAVFGVGLTMASVAAADPWTDPNGNLILNAPRGWTVRPQQMTGGTAVLAFTPSSDCYFFGIPNAASANASVSAARNTTSPLPASAWTAAVQGITDFVSAGAPTVASQSVDTTGFWPVQRAQLQSGDRTIYGTIQVRPGFELRGFCAGGSQASLDPMLNSMSHPNDQAWQAAAAAAPAAATPAAEEAPAAPAQGERPRRGRGMTTGAPSSAQ
jgi:hypothetical protein